MKRSLLILATLFFIGVYPLESQRILNKVRNAVVKEALGENKDESSTDSSKPGPEPDCARDDASLIVDLGRFKIDYREITICEKEDGSILLQDRITGKYYLSKDKKTEGPLEKDDPRVQECISISEETSDNQNSDAWVAKYPDYIMQSGDKYMIKFNGKNFGPYAIISDFAVSQTRDKFAALVTENVLMNENLSKKMEEELANAKSDQQRMEISMKYSQQIANQMAQPGVTESLQPKLVSNVAGAKYDAMVWMGGRLNGKLKLDDILVISQDKIIDLQGNVVIKIEPDSYSNKDLFVNSSNTRYASYKYGTLTFNDKTTLSGLFNPSLKKTDGKVYLTYLYYSPGKNAIMQAALPF